MKELIGATEEQNGSKVKEILWGNLKEKGRFENKAKNAGKQLLISLQNEDWNVYHINIEDTLKEIEKTKEGVFLKFKKRNEKEMM